MIVPDDHNQIFKLATQFVNQTDVNLFLTGKAGSGKTTFLKFIKETSHKKLVVVAPTGVAAINAGGVTIHSFFQLPLGNFIPDSYHSAGFLNGNFYNRQSLLRHMRLSAAKKSLIKELELLIIDEVSMVKADLLDAIDVMLRHVRGQRQVPFGGVQVLFLGDLFQLPPVAKTEEWDVLSRYYDSPFFFHAKALQNNLPLYLELKKIYRQNDEAFLSLLNNIRNGNIAQEGLSLLKEKYKPGFKPREGEDYIILTTHNYKAEKINKTKLAQLPGAAFQFRAVVTGEFNINSIPAEEILSLKLGAQVMFLKNDASDARRYYNGKIGTVKKIDDEKILVVFPDEGTEVLVEKETWKNLKYSYSHEEDYIKEEEIGACEQFPLRLAWAITIHKSQGLTFKKAIIDAGDSFAPGQVYVALSRLTSLDGLVLYSSINADCINTDKEAIDFSKNEPDKNFLLQKLAIAQKEYLHKQLIEAFTWQKLTDNFRDFLASLENRKIPCLDEAREVIKKTLENLMLQQKTAESFKKQLAQMLAQAGQDNYSLVHSRIVAAEKYFKPALHDALFQPLLAHYDSIKNSKNVKKYKAELQGLLASVKVKKAQLEQVVQIVQGLVNGQDPSALFTKKISPSLEDNSQSRRKSLIHAEKKVKGETQRISLSLFKEGKSINEIAAERNMALGTIEGHLITFISSGELELKDLVSEDKIIKIRRVLQNTKGATLKELKEILGEGFSYADIRAVSEAKEILEKI